MTTTPAPRLFSAELTALAPWDAASTLGFLSARALPGVEAGTPTSYSRSVLLPRGPAVFSVTAAAVDGSHAEDAIQTILCEALLTDPADGAPLVARLRHLLDLDTDPVVVDAVLSADPALRASVQAGPGIRVPGSMDAHEMLFRALIGQQVSVASARTALTRLTEALGARIELGPFTRLFPTADAIATGGHEVLRGPARRIGTIVSVAEKLASGDLRLDIGETREELEATLTALPGIGPWTAGYVAMRVLGSPDILLTSDLAIRQGAAKLGLPSKERELAAHAARWAPWRSYAGMHLWRAAQA